jgi:hypothetical protein
MSWLRDLIARTAQPRPAPRRRSRGGFRPRLEGLEDRCVPALLTVTSNGDDVMQAHTLRWAVANAQNGDEIEILPAPDGPRHITLTHGELFLNHNVYINAAGPFYATIDGNGSSRVFEVAPGAHVNLDDLFIIDGNAKANNSLGNASLDGDGGGILNEGFLNLHQCWVINNGHNGDGGYNYQVKKGGGIYNDNGNLLVYGCHVDGNFAGEAGGGIYSDMGVLSVAFTKMWINSTRGFGGAIATIEHDRPLATHVNLTSCDLEKNTAGTGGALSNQDCNMWVNICTLKDNQARASGGGIYNEVGQLTVSNSSLIHNTAAVNGGGIDSFGGVVEVDGDSYVYQNIAGAVGGGIYDDSSTVYVEHSHLEFNSALAGGGIYNYQGKLRVDKSYLVSNSTSFFGGGIANFEGTVWVSASQLTDNSAPVGGGIFNSLGTVKVGTTLFQQNSPDNIYGGWTDLGNNKFM